MEAPVAAASLSSSVPTPASDNTGLLIFMLIIALLIALGCIIGLCVIVYKLLHSRPNLAIGKIATDFPLWRRKLTQEKIHVHTHVIGGTGAGKSSFLISQMLQFIKLGVGFSFIDPHDTGEKLLNVLVSEGYFEKVADAYDRFIFIEFHEDNYFLPLNLLNNPRVQIDTLTSQVVKIFERLWQSLSHGGAPKFKTVMEHSLPVLIRNGLPLTLVSELLTDPKVRGQLLESIRESDPVIYRWWSSVFEKWGKDQREASIDSTQTRISLIAQSELLRYSLGMVEMALDFRKIMDEGKFVIYSLKKIKNDDAARLIGCILMSCYEEAAKTREELPEWERVAHQLLTDEFHEFSDTSSEAVSKMLSTSRKYGLFCWLVHQYWGQNNEHLQGATQMCERKIAFRVGAEDAEVMAKMHGKLDESEIRFDKASPTGQVVGLDATFQWWKWRDWLYNLGDRHFALKMKNEESIELISLHVSQVKVDPKRVEAVKRKYRDKWMKKKAEIELLQDRLARTGSLADGSQLQADEVAEQLATSSGRRVRRGRKL